MNSEKIWNREYFVIIDTESDGRENDEIKAKY